MAEMMMLERVGRAIAEANMEDFDELRNLHIAMAGAAVQAMREPTLNMTSAGRDYVRGYEDMRSLYAYWQAMIDAALCEHP